MSQEKILTFSSQQLHGWQTSHQNSNGLHSSVLAYPRIERGGVRVPLAADSATALELGTPLQSPSRKVPWKRKPCADLVVLGAKEGPQTSDASFSAV